MFCKVVILCISILLLTGVTSGESASFDDQWMALAEESHEKLAQDEEDLRAMFSLAVAYANLGQIQMAQKWFETVSQKPGRREETQFILEEIQEALEDTPQDVLLTGKYAFILFSQREYGEALPYMERLKELGPSSIWPRNYLALTLIYLNRHEEAHEVLDSSLEMEENRYTRAIKGYAYWEEGYSFKATRQFLRTGTLLFEIRDILD